jgi:SAM-dependent methyltransferase
MDTLDKKTAQAYGEGEFQNTYYLGYRDIPAIINMFCQGSKALDYGCGTGRSTRFLQDLGFQAAGVDISMEMLSEAKKHDSKGLYKLIESGVIPYENGFFDLVFSCFVFLTIPSFQELEKIFEEIARVLKPGGIFIFVTGSKYLYYKEYISYDVVSHPLFTTEEEIVVRLRDLGVSFKNYFYSEVDYQRLMNKAGLQIVQYHVPLGLPSDNMLWKDEALFGPYLVYTAKK